MLCALHIQDFVLINQLALNLDEGLTALTGETGAGKSILLEALGLAAGGRVSRGAVRRGAKKGVVSAAFDPLSSHPVWAVLDENGIASDDDQIILRRIQQADGKTRAFVNDQPVSVGLLRKVGETLLEIHGQHDGHGFLSAATHRSLLDEFGGHQNDSVQTRTAWRKWKTVEADLNERLATREQAIHEADYLRHVVGELAELSPEEGEEADLADQRTMLMAAEKITEDLSEAQRLLSEDGFEGQLAASARRLSRAAATLPADTNPLTGALAKVEAALSEIMEARSAVEDAAEKFSLGSDNLNHIEERLFALRAAARKHGVAPNALPEFYRKVSETLAELEGGESSFVDLTTQVTKAKNTYLKLAKTLSGKRRVSAKALDKAVAAELAPLRLGKAVFSTSITENTAEPGAEGIDNVEFMVATNPGAPAGPLKTIASGGELSRFVLAMKAALAAKESRTVIIFDEVDAGVGGAVADAVGERLSRLARDAQVLVVTHSPQVAARAKSHWRVEKTQSKSETITRVAALNEDERTEEIARMLSGAKVTDEARAAAAQLLGNPAPKIKRSARKRA